MRNFPVGIDGKTDFERSAQLLSLSVWQGGYPDRPSNGILEQREGGTITEHGIRYH